mmetsp:Transcript_14883/g.28872  ORF Transcript_14883/g.28872 Transcript_14883/m.28872 type:complete len:317 (+) Transcript_14883:86-1036(+)|eukprot:CAMPEP_0171573578 /NCGR_PEP_ID=MMETSP0961-20121227/4843_1 /TAXON_ID=87120 /ORGANISM="Aurantiochytrium limacinum, Strain ATCCMYA-1381" /LENGTH=316 /DNA_ID=CAMNT_0012128725 /DNA_START=63 /DNA_END=1013 /DNA_ORIENTATION=-
MRAGLAWWPALLRWLVAQEADVPSPELWEPRMAPSTFMASGHGESGGTCEGSAASETAVEQCRGTSPAKAEGVGDDDMEVSSGVGLFATDRIQVHETLFELPPSIFVKGDRWELAEWLVRENLTLEVIRVQQEVCESRPEDCAEMGELAEDDVLEAETWKPYLDSLPQTHERLPLGNVFLQAVAADDPRERTMEASDPIIRDAVDFMPDWMHEIEDGLGRWLFANALVVSRLHKVWYRDIFGDWELTTALVPLADLINAPAPGQKANVLCETSRKSGFFVCKSTVEIPPGEQLVVHYGDPDASRESLISTFGLLLG